MYILRVNIYTCLPHVGIRFKLRNESTTVIAALPRAKRLYRQNCVSYVIMRAIISLFLPLFLSARAGTKILPAPQQTHTQEITEYLSAHGLYSERVRRRTRQATLLMFPARC